MEKGKETSVKNGFSNTVIIKIVQALLVTNITRKAYIPEIFLDFYLIYQQTSGLDPTQAWRMAEAVTKRFQNSIIDFEEVFEDSNRFSKVNLHGAYWV